MTAQQLLRPGAVFLAGALVGLSVIAAFASTMPAHANPTTLAGQIICFEFNLNNNIIGNLVTLQSGDCGSQATSTGSAVLTVIKHVDNTGGGTAQASDFTMQVSGTNVSASSFPGSESGSAVSLDEGDYTVSETGGPANYAASFSGDCDTSGKGNILASSTQTCMVTNTYTPPPPAPSCTIVSDANTTDTTDGHAAVLVSPLNAAWTATSSASYDPSAAWVWSENPAINTDVNVTKVFTRVFDIVGAPAGGSIDIAADNGYVLKVNGTVVEDASTTEKNYVNSHHFDISSELVTGTNTVEVDVTNFGISGSSGSDNPAGVIFQVNLPDNNCGTVVPPPLSGTLAVTKVIVGGPSLNPDNFSFQVKEGSGVFGTALPFDPGGTSNMGVAPDTYTVVEVASSTYTTTYANSENSNADCNDLTVSSGNTTTCTVTNTYVTQGGGGGGPTPVNVVQTVVVHQTDLTTSPSSNTSSWFFYNDQTNTLDNTLGSFVDGPATAPLGAGSAQISATTTQGIILGTLGYIGTKLSDIASLTYSTYRSAGDPALALALQFDINPDVTVATTSYDGRLVYEPYYTHTVSDNTWQTWNTQDNATSAGHGNWWFSKGWIATQTGCSQATPCTWSQVLAALPNIGVSGTTLFKAGSNWSSDFTGNVDAFVLGTTDGTNSTTTTYDFEPTANNPGGGAGGNNTPNTPGGGGGGGGGILGGPLSVGFSNGGVVLGTSTEASDCPMYLTGYIRLGGNNDTTQVVKLQTFLDEFEGANLSITGIYDSASYNAVKAFQLKYASDVLTPWGETAPTGYVYYTTRKEVNTVYCDFTKQFPLTPQQLQEIEQFKAGIVGGTGTPGQNGGSNAPQNQGNPNVGLTNDAASLTASVEAGASSTNSSAPKGGSSWWQSLWHWLAHF